MVHIINPKSLYTTPLLIGSTAVMMSVFTGEAADKERAAFEEAGKCTTEASTYY